MSHVEDQIRSERWILDRFFELTGIGGAGIHCGPNVDGNPKPDFIVSIEGKRVGIEETQYYRDTRPDESYPRQMTESAWHELRDIIEKARQGCSELDEVHGVLEFRNLILPSPKEYKHFASELVKFTMSKIGELCSDGKRYTTFGEQHNLLSKYVKCLELKRPKCHMFWDWGHNADYIRLQEEELFNRVQAKIGKHVQSEVDENWLLITNGTQLSQQMGKLSVEGLNRYTRVCALLKSGPFDRVYIYDYAHSRIVLWTADVGWADVAQLSLS